MLAAVLGLAGASPAAAQALKATLPPTEFEVGFKAPLFRSLSDTTKGPELFLPAGAKVPVVGFWSARWATVSQGGYLYAVPAQRLKNFDVNALPKPALPKPEEVAPVLPLDPATKLVTYEAVVEVPGASKDQLYDRALEWMAKTYQSANDVVQIKDKEQGKLLAKGGILYVYNKQPAGYVIHTQTIYVKDGRYKYVMTGFKHQYISVLLPGGRDGSMGPLEQTEPPKGFKKKAWYDMLAGTDAKVKAMIADLQQAMLAQGRDPSKF
ncbi:hypothetical protein GCM10027594_09580 [Hymenobacter agri]